MLFTALASAVERRLRRFIAWEIAKTCEADRIAIATTAIGIAWALDFAGRLTNSVLERIHEVVTLVGHTFDTFHPKKVAQTHDFVEGPYIVAKDQLPYIVARFPDQLIIYKPPA